MTHKRQTSLAGEGRGNNARAIVPPELESSFLGLVEVLGGEQRS